MAAIDHIHSGARSGFVETLSAAFDRFKENRARHAVYRQTVRELSELTDRDLADLGIHRAMIRTLAAEAAYGTRG